MPLPAGNRARARTIACTCTSPSRRAASTANSGGSERQGCELSANQCLTNPLVWMMNSAESWMQTVANIPNFANVSVVVARDRNMGLRLELLNMYVPSTGSVIRILHEELCSRCRVSHNPYQAGFAGRSLFGGQVEPRGGWLLQHRSLLNPSTAAAAVGYFAFGTRRAVRAMPRARGQRAAAAGALRWLVVAAKREQPLRQGERAH
eukprot:4043141-Pleurochrysis_carterae.AAC.1